MTRVRGMTVAHGSSTVSVIGAKSRLREGQAIRDEDFPWRTTFYVGGQTLRSADVAWSLIDRLQGEFAAFEMPGCCASLRFGDCISIRAYRKVPDTPVGFTDVGRRP